MILLKIKFLLFWNFHFTILDLLNYILRICTIDGAANGASSTKDLLDGTWNRMAIAIKNCHYYLLTFKFAGHATRTHSAGHLDDFIESQVAIVLDVFHLLTVPRRFLQSLDDQWSCRGDHFDLSLTILDDQLNSDLQTLPVGGSLGNVITDFLRWKTKGTNLRG